MKVDPVLLSWIIERTPGGRFKNSRPFRGRRHYPLVDVKILKFLLKGYGGSTVPL